MKVQNPILPGFNADPTIARDGDTYLIATSTFEWFPGVALYRSDNLRDWRLERNVLNRPSQIELRGVNDSCGVWAPQLSYHPDTNRWYLAYTIVTNLSDSFFDLKNCYVSAEDPTGEWSDPRFLNASGFDPALFHDDDGTSWVTNLSWEFRKGYRHPGPIVLRQWDLERGIPAGPERVIYRGDPHFGCTEGPQIYRREGWYYLVTAEGGTGYGHAVLVSRSRNVQGPYEPSPHNPLLTSRAEPHPAKEDADPDFLKSRFFNPAIDLQKAGHGSMVDTPTGETVLAHLCARPLLPELRSTLNRETALQRVEWKDGWPVILDGPHPRTTVAFAGREDGLGPDVSRPGRDEFETHPLSPHFYSLRCPIEDDWCSLSHTPGSLSLRGRNSIYSRIVTSVIARRIQHFCFHAKTLLRFAPEGYRQSAGLLLMNSAATWFLLRQYYSETLGSPALGIMTSDLGRPDEHLDSRIALSEEQVAEGVVLQALVNRDELIFGWAYPGEEIKQIGPSLDASKLSDEYNNDGQGAFSGSFIGMHAYDSDRMESWAEFDYFDYRPCEETNL
jgi:xylan 1,4-beta-xylosidase